MRERHFKKNWSAFAKMEMWLYTLLLLCVLNMFSFLTFYLLVFLTFYFLFGSTHLLSISFHPYLFGCFALFSQKSLLYDGSQQLNGIVLWHDAKTKWSLFISNFCVNVNLFQASSKTTRKSESAKLMENSPILKFQISHLYDLKSYASKAFLPLALQQKMGNLVCVCVYNAD